MDNVPVTVPHYDSIKGVPLEMTMGVGLQCIHNGWIYAGIVEDTTDGLRQSKPQIRWEKPPIETNRQRMTQERAHPAKSGMSGRLRVPMC
jgi:hypothetical protein